MSAEQQQPTVTVEASRYVPFDPQQQRRKISPAMVMLVLAALVAVLILAFVFLARSVSLTFSTPPDSVEISGGPTFELGGVVLMLPGSYDIQASAAGYEPLAQTFEVTPMRQQEVNLNFTPLPGLVRFGIDPADAEVQVDGVPVDTSAPVSLAAGEHEVSVRHPRYQPQTVLLDVIGRSQAQDFSLQLTPNWGDVTVTSQPAGAEVHIDGVPSGLLTPAVVEVLAGEREVSVHLDGHRSARRRLVVAAEVADTLPEFELVQADATLSVVSRPAGAGITVDGQFMGTAPLTMTLRSGERYRVEAILEGHRRAQQRVQLAKGSNPALEFALVQELGTVNIQARPAGAQLRLDGRLLGEANRSVRLPLRPHTVEIELEGYAAYKTTINPRVGIDQAVRVQLLTVEEARRRALKPRYTTASGQEMVLLEPAPIQLGASRREPGRRANETLRNAELQALYYLSRTEVTNAQYRGYIGAHDSGEFEGNTLNKDEQPAVDVSWTDAALYCNWLSEQEGRTPFYTVDVGRVTGYIPAATGYRLPTEAEWAWAARTQAGTDALLRYPWGNNLPPPDRHGNYADRAAQHLVGRIIYGYNDNYVVTAPVGSYGANFRDLYDLGGNVAEWVHDFYQIPKADAPVPRFGPADGEFRVIKGSSWMHGTVTDLRLSFRDYGTDGRQDLGFRIARNAE